MKSVHVSIDVANEREEVYAFLDILPNHEAFTDHMLVDWQCSGPRSGVGARARMRFKKPGRADWMELEVVDAESPRRIVEETHSAGGRRRTRGTYVLEELPGGGTAISFELAWLQAPLSDRLIAPLARALLKRGNAKAMRRLAAQLGDRR